MKKLLLFFSLLFVNAISFGQIFNQPSQFNNICDDNNDGIASFYMQEISLEILGNNNPQNYIVTHHLSQSDASLNINSLPNIYTNISNPQLIFVRIENTVTNQIEIITYNLTVNATPLNNPFTFQSCDNDGINDGISVFPELSFFDYNWSQNGQNNVTYYYSDLDATTATNAIPSNLPFQNQVPQMQVLFVRIQNTLTSCYSISQLFLAVQDCNNQGGQPIDLFACGTTTACFNLTQNDQNVLGSLNPSQYLVTYYTTSLDATNGNNPILTTTQYCTSISQQIFVRLLNLQNNSAQVLSFGIYPTDVPPAPTQTITVCANDNTSFLCWDLTIIIPNIGGTSETVTFYQNQQDAFAGMNAIPNPSCFISLVATPTQPPLYYRLENVAGCFSVGIIELIVIDCANNCQPPLAITIADVTPFSVTIVWANNTQNGFSEYYISTSNIPPTFSTIPNGQTPTGVFSASIIGLTCETTYYVYVRNVCSPTEYSNWSNTISFTTSNCGPQGGQPQNLSQCIDVNGSFCFDLSFNDAYIIGTLNPSEHTITYHASANEAETDINPLISPYCLTQGNYTIFGRLENNNNLGFSTSVFYISAQSYFYSQQLPILEPMNQCDDNNDGVIVFDLTSAQAQINTLNTLTYYTTNTGAETATNPITNPNSYTVPVQSNANTIFIRETIESSCDTIYSMQLRTFANCNSASFCILSNSLCGSLGIPFGNSVNTSVDEGGADYGCLGSHPNPTWFYLPISQAGGINLMIQQNMSVDFNIPGLTLDIDYIVYGPYTNPTEPCYNQLTANKIVSCSFSPATTEFPIIPNAQPGEFYLIMVTNFSNQPGFIKITDLGGNNTGGIDCSGLRMNAFLDSNSNGNQDNGEQNFPLGQFNYQLNNNGIIHNITAPSGVYNLYDINPSNFYELSYTIDPAYITNYNLTTSSYSNVSIVVGGGMITYNFPITVANAYTDLAVSIVSIGAPRPGFLYQNKILYTNLGNQNMPSGNLTFTKDVALTITNVSEAVTSTSSGFGYNFSNLAPYETRSILVTMQVPIIPNVIAGQFLTNSTNITPLTDDDVFTENNTSTLSEMVINSYDPNDKMESHGSQIVHDSFTVEDYLYYTIRFENTGNGSAVNVRVNDVLDSQLDETTVKMVSASHPYVMDRIDNNLTWRFDNIQLPVSITNTDTGKGYLMFKVKPKADFTIGDIIPNTASIFFDFNPAIVTNTFYTEFVTTLAVNEFENDNFTLFPNPTSDVVNITLKNNSGFISEIAVFDVLGKKVFAKKENELLTTENINLKALSAGIYFIEVTTNIKNKVIKKLIVR